MTNITDNLKYWLALKLVEGLGNIGIKSLLGSFGTPEHVFKAPLHLLETVPGIGSKTARHIKDFKQWEQVYGEIEKALRMNIAILTCQDPLFPQRLRHIYDCPVLIYVKGELRGLDVPVAVVGSRKASAYGKYTTERLCRELALSGVAIVSGMARGIDASAHRGALSVKGRTIAVLGSGLDVIYPPENESLYYEISECGAVVSEYSFGTRPNAPNFPARNRIISGISLGVVVVEATEKSGSLITARIALEQGREVFAVPGSIDEAGSRGTNRLIKEGAKLVEDVDDILAEIGPQTSPGESIPVKEAFPAVFTEHLSNEPTAEPTDDSSDETPVATRNQHRQRRDVQNALLDEKEQVLITNLSSQPCPVDDLISATGMSASEILSLLLHLELRGLIRQMPGKTYILQE
ncbi:MAG: DNA-processing protein DprA [Syntrophales bacterium]|nr:DNA-processing protein DprA [Syntrophales bacterium]MCK9391273.1 DNA-processing protein DprA [Syntrophales bacterium]